MPKYQYRKLVTQTPPMGWNSYSSAGMYISAKSAMENLEAFAEKLATYRSTMQ